MNAIDRFLCELDTGLRTAFASVRPARAIPVPAAPGAALDERERRASIGMMRVNHVGEVCAQALYQGQALAVRDVGTRRMLERAAGEERDHLAWCAERVEELGGRTSILAPAFYVGAWTIGVVSGLMGDRWSMGFLVETERQVEAHLEGHLDRLAQADTKSRAIVDRMRLDEIEHGDAGLRHGGIPLPPPVRSAMRASAKLMTATTYWV